MGNAKTNVLPQQTTAMLNLLVDAQKEYDASLHGKLVNDGAPISFNLYSLMTGQWTIQIGIPMDPSVHKMTSI